MQYMDRAAFLAVQDINTKDVSIPGAIPIKVRALKASEANAYAKASKQLNHVESAVLMCAYSMVDENGERLFDPTKKEDTDLIASKSFANIMLIFNTANKLSESSSAEEVDKKEKNLETTGSDSSPSSSV